MGAYWAAYMPIHLANKSNSGNRVSIADTTSRPLKIFDNLKTRLPRTGMGYMIPLLIKETDPQNLYSIAKPDSTPRQ